MKMTNLLIMFSVIGFSNVFGQGKDKFHMRASHTPQECLKTLDAAKSKGENFLSILEWGCMWGDHAAYAFINASSETAAKKMLPVEMQEHAIINRIGKFTLDEIDRMHAATEE